ncbi:MAG: hypothetical protein RL685_2491 [Pseudomonadota bacterium]
MKAAAALQPVAARRGLGRQLGLWSALGVLGAAVIAVCANLLVARHYTRWDVTRAQLYTLSPASLETLGGLSEDVEILVFLAQADPELASVKRLLEQYAAASPLVQIRYIDPDREPGEFLALQNRYRLTQGRTEQGQLVSDAALVVTQGEARWVINGQDILGYDEQRGTVQPRLEQAVTEGLRQVLHPQPTEVCFSHGQQEASMEDGGPTGLGGLRYTLEKNNYGTRQVDLTQSAADIALQACDLIVIAAPADVYTDAAVGRLLAAARRGKSFLISLGPTLGEDNHTTRSGLERLLELFGVHAREQLVFERDPDRALPFGVGGEVFFALPKPHAVTRGLLKDGEARFRVLLQLAQGFELQGKSVALLETSGRAFSVRDAGILVTPKTAFDGVVHDAEGPFVVAAASELERGGKPEERAARLIVIGSSVPLLGKTWQDEKLTGTRRFVESAVSWAAARPTLVSLVEKPERQVELRLTEGAMSEIARYVLIYMPVTALACAALVLFRRRSARAAGATGAGS